jgi:hypothetical protein
MKLANACVKSGTMDHESLAARLSGLLSQMHGRVIVHDAYRALEGDEGPLLHIDRHGYHLVWIERGQETSRQSTSDAEGMVYRILADSAFSAGVAYELAHRLEGPDFRRTVHARQRELFARLGPEWCAQLEAEIAGVLAEHPYLDAPPSQLSGE